MQLKWKHLFSVLNKGSKNRVFILVRFLEMFFVLTYHVCRSLGALHFHWCSLIVAASTTVFFPSNQWWTIEARSIDAGISIQTEVACAPITGTRTRLYHHSVVILMGQESCGLQPLVSLVVACSCCADVSSWSFACESVDRKWCFLSVFGFNAASYLLLVKLSVCLCYSLHLTTVLFQHRCCVAKCLLFFFKSLSCVSFPSVLLCIFTNRDEREKHPVCNKPTHTRALQCDEHSRFRSNHLPLFISFLLTAFRDRGPHSWGAPPITLHPGQNLRGQQQCSDPQHWPCQVTSLP